MSNRTLLSATSLEGTDVKNFQDQSLGDVKDFMIDTNTGHVRYAVMDFGGFLGIGNKLFAVPMKAMKVDTENECLKLDADKEKLENAEGFDKDNWPNFADTQWQNRIDQYYHV